MHREQEIDRIFRDYLERIEKGDAVDLKKLFSRHGELETALWERFWTWEEARAFFKVEREQDDVSESVPHDPDLYFALHQDRGDEYGRRIGEFTLLKEIGRGTMGVVFLARQAVTDRLVALKLLAPFRHKSPTARERFRREVTALGRLRNRHIVSILTAGDAQGIPFFAMDLVCGMQMDELLDQLKEHNPLQLTGAAVENIIQKNLPDYMKAVTEPDAPSPASGSNEAQVFSRPYVEVACRFIIQMADALEHAHTQGIVHRDVKPSNVLVDVHGTCRLSDFGLACELSTAALTKSGELVGTPYYAAPEQLIGKRAGLDSRADIFSLGVTLYELICLQLPFTGDNPQQIFNQILVKNPKSPRIHNPGVPRDLETILFKCLEKDPDSRYQTAGELAEDLRAFLGFRPIKARPAGPIKGFFKLIRRQRLVAAALTVALAAVLVLAGFLLKIRWDSLIATRELEAAVQQEIGKIRTAIDEDSLEGAQRAFERLVGLDDSNPQLDDLRREIALLHCHLQLAESERLRADYKRLKSVLDHKEDDLDRLEKQIASQYTDLEERIAADDLRRELRELAQKIADKDQEISEVMNRARAHAMTAGRDDYPRVAEAFAAYFMDRWEEALDANNRFSMEHYAARVIGFDREGRYTQELEGSGTIMLEGTEGAEAYLFRYESYRKVSARVGADRLVPVPSRGQPAAALVSMATGFFAGDPCLLVRDGGLTVLDEGDLVLSIDGRPAAEDIFVEEVVSGGAADLAGVVPFQQILKIRGRRRAVEDVDHYAFSHFIASEPCRIGVSSGTTFECTGPGSTPAERGGLRAVPASRLLAETPAPATVELQVIHRGQERIIEIPAGDVAGIDSEITAFPLYFGSQNLMGRLPIKPFQCAPGSYLIVLKKPGMENLRLPVNVLRKRPILVTGNLLPRSTSPPGYVRIAGGRFVSGGDKDALWADHRSEHDLKEFWIARREVTIEEWFEFVNHPEILEDIERWVADGKYDYLPRYRTADLQNIAENERDQCLAYRDERSRQWRSIWSDPQTPVVGVSLQDIRRFIKWKQLRADIEGKNWTYALPSQLEWEKATRGVDQRAFPWGDLFDHSFCKCEHSHALFIRPVKEIEKLERGASHPYDESPYGVRDLAGSVVEWNRDLHAHLHSIRGGAYDVNRASLFRAASRDNLKSDSTSHNLGFRLVIHFEDRNPVPPR